MMVYSFSFRVIDLSLITRHECGGGVDNHSEHHLFSAKNTIFVSFLCLFYSDVGFSFGNEYFFAL